MVSLIPSLFAFLQKRQAARPDRARWSRDPLGHPDIAAMDARQLADLPAAELREKMCG